LSGHQGLVESAVAELTRPAIGRWWRCSPFHSSIAWNGTSCAAKRQWGLRRPTRPWPQAKVASLSLPSHSCISFSLPRTMSPLVA